MDLTNLHALLNAQKALWQRIDFASTRIQAAKYPSLLPYRRIGDPAFGVDTCAAQCYKTRKASPLVVSLLAHLNQRVRPQTCLAGQGCMAAEGIVM